MELEEYLERFHKEITRQLEIDRKKLNEAYQRSKDIYIKKCGDCIKELLLKCKERQENGEKDAIDCVGVHFLRTSVRTKSFEYKIALYNDKLFHDRKEVAVYWEPPYMKEVAEASVHVFRALLKKECIRIPEYDIKMFCENYLFQLMQTLPLEIVENLKRLCEMEEFLQLDHEAWIAFYFGEYLMKQQELWPAVCILGGGIV